MKNRLMGFITGILVAALTFGLVGTALAASQKDATLYYNDIKITLDGETITPRDVNGDIVEPFIIDGTTYLPIRAAANALGMYVAWDGDNHQINLWSSVESAASALFPNSNIDATLANIVWEATLDAVSLDFLVTSTNIMPTSTATKELIDTANQNFQENLERIGNLANYTTHKDIVSDLWAALLKQADAANMALYYFALYANNPSTTSDNYVNYLRYRIQESQEYFNVLNIADACFTGQRK